MKRPTTSSTPPAASLECPLCGADNGCAIASGNDPATCWCQQQPVTAGLQAAIDAQLPPDLRGSGACVCAGCLAALRAS